MRLKESLISKFRDLDIGILTGVKVPSCLVFLQCAEVSRDLRHPVGSNELSIVSKHHTELNIIRGI